MRSLVLALTLLAIPLAAAADGDGIVIHAISPAALSPDDTTRVTIHGENLATTCILPCPTTVTRDGAAVEVVTSTHAELIFLAPPPRSGVSAFLIRRGDGVTREISLRTVDAAESRYEKVLLPIWIEQTPGAFGSQWTTGLTIHNSGRNPLRVAHYACTHELACPTIFPLTFTIPAGETAINPDIARNKAGVPPGRLIYFSIDEAVGARVSLRLRDHARDPLYGGTELPVVRERQFFAGTVHLVDVPIDPRFRQTLRIYDADAAARAELTLRIYALGAAAGAPPIVETTIATTGTPASLADSPGYAQILDLSAAYPGIRAAGRLRIEIEPGTPGLRYWAFVSLAEQTTQRVTTILPQ